MNLEQTVITNELINPKLNDWNKISKNIDLTEEFVEKYKNKIQWKNLNCKNLSEPFIEKHLNKLDLKNLCKSKKLSEQFIDKHLNKLTILNLLETQKLSEDFLERHYQDYCTSTICCIFLSKYQNLSETFMEKHQDIIKWGVAFEHQNLSEKFKDKWKHKISNKQKLNMNLEQTVITNELINPQLNNWKEISKNKHLSANFLNTYKNKLDWEEVSNNVELNEEILKTFKDYFNLETLYYRGDLNNCLRISLSKIILLKGGIS